VNDGPESDAAPPAVADVSPTVADALPEPAAARAEELELPPRPPIRPSAVTIVLPITPPAPPLDPVVARWKPLLDKLPPGSRLLLIDDAGAWPETETPTELIWPTVVDSEPRVVRHVVPLGRGGALGTGLRLVDTPLVLVVDDDGAFDPADCLKLCESIDLVDIACACRSVGPTPRLIAAFERVKSILARIFLGYEPDPRVGWSGVSGWRGRWVARRGFGVPVADPLAGLFLARTSAIRDFTIQSRGSFAWTELLAKANHTECLLTDVAIAATKPVGPDADFAADAWRVFSHPDFGPPRRLR
jgi:Glycosyl transferase family 2